jgi:hypothetical protein
MKDDPEKADPNARRTFLKGAGATLALASAAGAPAQGLAQTAPAAVAAVAAPGSAGAPGYQSLGLEESAATEALVEHMWPADPLTASGVSGSW